MDNIVLESGLTLIEPEFMIETFVCEEYDYWDAPPEGAMAVQQDSMLTMYDILYSVLINSNIRREGVWNFWDVREQVGAALAEIADDVSLLSLTEPEVPWDALECLFETCTVPWVKLATATKVLHKKRPKLIPILDSVLQNYYCSVTDSILPDEEWEKGVWVMQRFRDDLLACECEINQLCNTLEEQARPLTPVRVLEALIWMEKEAKGHYRGQRADYLEASASS